MPFKILVVDDKINEITDRISELPAILEKAGYAVRTTADGNAAYDLFWEYKPDLVLLDVELRTADNGIDICEAIRLDGSTVPIILISRYYKETKDVVRGFDVGADDYIRRPTEWPEVMARIRANLPPAVTIVNDHILINFATRQVCIKSGGRWQKIELQPLEFELLQILVKNAGIILPATMLKEHVWGKVPNDNLLRNYVHRLRKKIERDPTNPEYIETIFNMGYRFNGMLISVGSDTHGCTSK